MQNDGKEHFLYTIVEKGQKLQVERTSVTVLKQFLSNTVIATGINENTVIVTEGYNGLVAGDEVHIVTH